MSNVYLDIDSSYRNRQLWPIPGEFEIPIAQTGNKEKGNAFDPVCLSEPVAVWSCNALTTSAPSTFQIAGIIATPQTYGNSGYNQGNNSLTLIFNDVYNHSVQTIEDYYVGLIFWNVTNTQFSRITSYKFVGDLSNGIYSKALITISSPIDFNFGDSFCITDTTDLTDFEYPLFFVPNGKNQNDAYLNYLLYCETNNDYRKITFYTSLDKYLSCEPFTNINDLIYQKYGNFCIRKEVPAFPLKLENSQFVSTSSTSSKIIVNIAGSCSLTQFTTSNYDAIKKGIAIPYKYDFLRIRPYRNTVNTPSIFAAGKQSSVSDLASSEDGLSWTNININAAFNTITNGIFADTQLAFIAGGSDPITTLIKFIYSYDGIIWNNITASLFEVDILSSYFYDTYLFIGSEWNSSPSFGMCIDSTFANWIQYCNPFGSPFSATGSNTGGTVKGITAFYTGTLLTNLRIVVVGENTSTNTIKKFIYGDIAKNQIGTTTITWAEPTSDPFSGGSGNAIKYSSGQFVIAVGYNTAGTDTIAVSANGGEDWILPTWTVDNPNPFSGGEGTGIGYNGSYWVAVGFNSSLSITIARSYDGLIWQKSANNPFDGVGYPKSIIWSGSYWIVGGGSSVITGTVAIATSPDGLIWTPTYKESVFQKYNFFNVYALSIYRDQNFANIGIYCETLKSQSKQIISYINNGTTATFEVYPPFEGNNLFATAESYTIEVEGFSNDNFVPFTYIGTLIHQQSCYEVELINLILPNFTLSTGTGSKIAFYPYVYVEISNVSASGSYLTNIMYSNNPNAVRVIFKIPIYDVQDPESTPYVRLVSASMIQTIKFKPDDNLYFKVLLPNGDVFNTLLPESYSPEIPNSNCQVSATFRFRRI